MKPLTLAAQRIFDQLVAGLHQPGEARRIDNAAGTFMYVAVERLDLRMFSVSHYGVQNGDLMADPDMTFYVADDGRVYPLSFRNDYVGVDQTSAWFEDGRLARYAPKLQRDHAAFASTWMQNIKTQQGL